MRLFLTFFVCYVSFIPAPILADWSVKDISSNPTESPSEDGNLKQASQFDDGFGSELIAGVIADCAPDSIQFTGKLGARMIPCPPPSTSIDGNGKYPKTDDGEESPNDTGRNDNGHQKYPGPFILTPPRPFLPPLVPDPSNLCPPTTSGTTQYIICHEGLEYDMHDGGDWISNAIWCDEFFTCLGTRWCCIAFWEWGFIQRESHWQADNAYLCKPMTFYRFQIPGLSL